MDRPGTAGVEIVSTTASVPTSMTYTAYEASASGGMLMTGVATSNSALSGDRARPSLPGAGIRRAAP
ncbi:hypothetical protein [Nocardia sp. NPDC057440]|uniref:hypothetical protein n=1 Tax=Nocardia sp. NPDC057440 TaxID=3346134 RepID=UPI0036730D1B